MLTEIKPSSLKDKEVDSLLQSADSVLIEIFQKIINSLIYPRIDSLSGEVLDLLAWQFHIEGWELARTEEEKRELIKKAIELHKYKGTKWAIEEVLRTLGLIGEVKEWFQYNGQPYRFKVELGVLNKEINLKLRDRLISLINEYKNARSWLDEIVLAYLVRAKLYPYVGSMAEVYSDTDMDRNIRQKGTGNLYPYVGSMAEVYGSTTQDRNIRQQVLGYGYTYTGTIAEAYSSSRMLYITDGYVLHNVATSLGAGTGTIGECYGEA